MIIKDVHFCSQLEKPLARTQNENLPMALICLKMSNIGHFREWERRIMWW